MIQAIGMNKVVGNNVSADTAPTFVEDTAKKAGIAQALSTNKVLGVVTVENTPTTVKSFVEDTATKAGLSESVIKQETQISRSFTPEMKAHVKKADLSKTEAIKLARLEPENNKQL